MIAVIGAGPAGSYYASKVKDEEVHLFEEHKTVGDPIACTGILTDAVDQFVRVPGDLVVSRIRQFKMVAPSGEHMYVDLKKTNRVLHRGRFDRFLFEKAQDNGVNVHLGERFGGMKKQNGAMTITTPKRAYACDRLVGADGPFSPVAKAAGIFGRREFVMGYQARVRYPELEEGVTTVHLGRGEFSWIVPEDGRIARVGVIGKDAPRLKADYKALIGEGTIMGDQSGVIPLYSPRQKIRKGNVFLLGDAATHVKATTYGGIVYGMIAGDHLARDPEGFERNVKKKLARDLWISLKMRQYLNHMSERQADELIEIFRKKGNNDILASHDRNFPSKFMVQLLMKEAKLWKLGFGLFKNKALGI